MSSDAAETFQHYRVLRRDDGSLWKLGAGAMGVTYKAIDTNLDAPVALKVINAAFTSNDAARERFIREAKAAASLRHRNVASIHHLGQDGDTFFYAMEFIDGETVEHFVKREGPQSWRVALPAALQVTRALMAAHEKRLVHRDIKPANVMLVHEVGEDDLVIKVIDFGLAKTLVEENGSVVNVSGSGFLGTPLYASPEQCEELAPDIRSDIYSLGVTLWFVLTGRPPFEGGLGKVFSQHLHAPPPWVQLPAATPEPVRALLTRMLAKERADRPQTPADLRREIDACLRACGQSVPRVAPPVVAESVIVGSGTADSLVAETTLNVPPDEGPVAETFLETPVPAPAPALPPPAEARRAEALSAGFSLEEVLRQNEGRLPAAVVADLLGPLAQIVDAAGAVALDLTPRGIWTITENTEPAPSHSVSFTDAWLTEGKPRRLEVHLLDAASPPTPSSNETMPPRRVGLTAPVVALAALAYELLDGAAPDFGRGYRPLSGCNEESNVFLRRALESGPGTFTDAGAFAGALGPSLRGQPAKAIKAPLSSLIAPTPPKLRGRMVNIVVAVMAALLLITLVGKRAVAPDAKPVAHPPPTPTPSPTSAPSPKPTPPLTPTPPPTPDPRLSRAKSYLQAARREATSIDTGYDRASAIAEIASTQAHAGDVAASHETFALALQTARTARDADGKSNSDFALRNVACSQNEAGDVSSALETARDIHEDLAIWQTMEAVVERPPKDETPEARHQNLAAAAQIAQTMTRDTSQAIIMTQIGTAQTQAGDFAGSRQSLAVALQCAQAESATLSCRVRDVVDVAVAQHRAGDTEASRQSLALALTFAKTSNDAADKAEAFANIAAAQAEVGNQEVSRQYFALALKTVSNAKLRAKSRLENDPKSIAYLIIADFQAKSAGLPWCFGNSRGRQ